MHVKYIDLPRQFQDPELHREQLVSLSIASCAGAGGRGIQAQFAQVCGTRWAVGVTQPPCPSFWP